MRYALTSARARAIIFGAVILVAVGFALAGLDIVRRSLSGGTVSVALLLTLIPFAAWSYGLRTYRWHILVRSVSPGVSPLVSCYAQVIGFAFSVSPGRIAELYKLRLVERGTGTSIAQLLPAIVVERLTDAVVLGLLVVVGGILHLSAAAHGDLAGSLFGAVAVLIGLGLVVALRGRVDWPHVGRHVGAGLGRTSLGGRLLAILGSRRVTTLLGQLRTGGRRVTRPETIGLALAFVLLGRLGDGIILWKLSLAVGYPVSFPLALMIIGASGLLGGVSFSPGGIGAAEAALVGLITANGMPLSLAIVTAFTTRALLFWMWVVLGLCAFVVSHGFPFVKRSLTGYAIGVRRPEPSTQQTPR